LLSKLFAIDHALDLSCPMPPVALQFVLRLALGIAIGIGLTPASLAAASFHRLSCWCLLILGVTAAALVHLDGEPAERSGGVIFLAILLSVLACAAAAFYQRGRNEAGRAAVFGAGLSAVLAVSLATGWSRVTSGLGMWLALADLVSSGLLLGVILATLWLGLWHLNTACVQRLPLEQLAGLAGAALAVRTVLGVLGMGIALFASRQVPGLFWLFLVFRWVMALLTCWLLRILAREIRQPLGQQSVAVLVYLALFASLAAELGTQLVSVEIPYTV